MLHELALIDLMASDSNVDYDELSYKVAQLLRERRGIRLY